MRPVTTQVLGYKVAILGLGDAGMAMHLPALQGIAGVVVAGACDPDPVRRAAASSRWKIPVFATSGELIAAAKPDLVVVATPPDTHPALCIEAFNAGADVLCEKPFAETVDEADDVLSAAASAGRRIALNHEFREMPIFRALVDASADRDHITFAQAWQSVDMPPWNDTGWRGRMRRRTLHEAGVHLVDLLVAVFGEMPLAVSATFSGGGIADGESDAVGVATLEFSRGRIAQLIQNRIAKGDPRYFEARVDTDTATYRASFGGHARFTMGLLHDKRLHARLEYGLSGIAWREQGHSRRTLARNPADPRVAATRSVLEQTIAAFRSGAEPPTSGAHARDLLAVVDACYRSAATRERIHL